MWNNIVLKRIYIIFAATFSLAVFFVFMFAPVLAENSQTSCEDSDDGKNYYVRGAVTWSLTGGEMHEVSDSCSTDGMTLLEYYCYYDSTLDGYFSDVEYYTCQYGCQDGTCVEGEETFYVYFDPQTSQTVSGSVTICAITNIEADSVQFHVVGDKKSQNYDSDPNLSNLDLNSYCFNWDTTGGSTGNEGFPDGDYFLTVIALKSGFDDTQDITTITVQNQAIGGDGGGDGGTTEFTVQVDLPSEYVTDLDKIIVFGTVDFSATSNQALDSLEFYFDNLNTAASPDYTFIGSSQDNLSWVLLDFDTNQLLSASYRILAQGFIGNEARLSNNSIDIFVENPVYIYFDPQPPELVSGQLYFYAQTSQPVPNVKFQIIGADQETADFQILEDGLYDYENDLAWRYFWDTTAVINGSYQIKAIILDEAGKILAETYFHDLVVENIEEPPSLSPSAEEPQQPAEPERPTLIEPSEESPLPQPPLLEEPVKEPSPSAEEPQQPAEPERPITPPAEKPKEPKTPPSLEEPGNRSEEPQQPEALPSTPIIVKPVLLELCLQDYITNQDECQRQIQVLSLPLECQKQNITSKVSCEEFFNQKYVKPECQEVGITERDQCLEYIENKYLTEVECADIDEAECRQVLKEELSGYLVERQIRLGGVREIMPKNQDCPPDRPCTYVRPTLTEVKDISPIVLEGTSEITLSRAVEEVVVTVNKEIVSTAPAVINFDIDQDGLPDELEKRLGTDLYNPDTDGDGFSDRDELISGFDPFGPGEKEIELAPVEEAIVNQVKFEQPRTAGIVKEEYRVEKVESIEDQQAIKLSGSAEPNVIVTIYIYSDLPLMITTRTNEYGNWEYILQKSLVDGNHEVYVALNDNTGKVVYKSNPLTFFVREAKAVSVQDYIKVAEEETADESIKLYLTGAAILIFGSVTLFLAYFLQRKKIKDENKDTAKS